MENNVFGKRDVQQALKIIMTADYYTQHIQCTREEKLECLHVVKDLLVLAFAAKEEGFLKMDELLRDRFRFQDKFLCRAAGIVVETADQENVEEVLYNLIFTSSEMGNNKFFKNVLIAETMLALGRGEDLDYIFAYLVPSFFGVEYVDQVEELYYQSKRAHLSQKDGTPPENEKF